MNLTDTEVRILGSLIEKESTTPDNYPLSLNALTNACNQLSNRDPVTTLSEDSVKWAVNSLRQHSLVRAIQPSDSRVMKFLHLLTDKWELEPSQLGVLCVLMLRGPQTVGEIKSRTGRLAEFTSLAQVEGTLTNLIGLGRVVELARRPGRKESRYAHTLSGATSESAEVDATATSAIDTAIDSQVRPKIHTGAPQANADPRDAPQANAAPRDAPQANADPRDARINTLEHSVAELQRELTELRSRFEEFQKQFG
ncbi:MAG: YceH family protein [Gemmatimonadaceae bacterium]